MTSHRLQICIVVDFCEERLDVIGVNILLAVQLHMVGALGLYLSVKSADHQMVIYHSILGLRRSSLSSVLPLLSALSQ